jgi:hypothetical protein
MTYSYLVSEEGVNPKDEESDLLDEADLAWNCYGNAEYRPLKIWVKTSDPDKPWARRLLSNLVPDEYKQAHPGKQFRQLTPLEKERKKLEAVAVNAGLMTAGEVASRGRAKAKGRGRKQRKNGGRADSKQGISKPGTAAGEEEAEGGTGPAAEEQQPPKVPAADLELLRRLLQNTGAYIKVKVRTAILELLRAAAKLSTELQGKLSESTQYINRRERDYILEALNLQSCVTHVLTA